jgi:hypothetical protein
VPSSQLPSTFLPSSYLHNFFSSISPSFIFYCCCLPSLLFSTFTPSFVFLFFPPPFVSFKNFRSQLQAEHPNQQNRVAMIHVERNMSRCSASRMCVVQQIFSTKRVMRTRSFKCRTHCRHQVDLRYGLPLLEAVQSSLSLQFQFEFSLHETQVLTSDCTNTTYPIPQHPCTGQVAVSSPRGPVHVKQDMAFQFPSNLAHRQIALKLFGWLLFLLSASILPSGGSIFNFPHCFDFSPKTFCGMQPIGPRRKKF